MAFQYNYYVDQTNYTREPPARAYSYQPFPTSTEKKTDSFQRYSNFYKIFNNRRSLEKTNFGTDNISQQEPAQSQNNVGVQPKTSKKGGNRPHRKVRFAEQKEEIGGGDGHKMKQADAVEESVDAAADGFINWKRRSLQMSKTFADSSA